MIVRPRAPKKLTEDGKAVLEGEDIVPGPSVKTLGLTVQLDNKATTSLRKLKHTSVQILDMLQRVATRQSEMTETDTLKLVQPFIIWRVTCAIPYLLLSKGNMKQVANIIPKAVKQAIGVPEKIKTKPIPKNMNPACHGGRRKTRARALTRELGNGEDGTNRAVAVVTTKKKLLMSVSMEIKDVEDAEKVVIALALTLPGCTRVVTDSQQAYRSVQSGWVSRKVQRGLKNKRPPKEPIKFVWVPAHSAVEGNELAHQQARALTYRATAVEEVQDQPMMTYRGNSHNLPQGKAKTAGPASYVNEGGTRSVSANSVGVLPHLLLLSGMFSTQHCKNCPIGQEMETLRNMVGDCTFNQEHPPPLSPTTSTLPPLKRWKTCCPATP
ncbi:hypothetical protein HPB47_026336 [Ixodes persulcatus]|uniref:Uncharacterized protein n=1 Tax=Ixodes persulcatus TaxID=34615 RepID=A0AC60PZ00_IXOPE|nr:hypothetical protein HPB47_026336 [Ixodes persulcatus]